MTNLRLLLFCILLSCPFLAFSSEAQSCSTALQLEQQWALIRYQAPKQQRLVQLNRLLKALTQNQTCQQKTHYLIVEAMIRGSLLKGKTGLSAFKHIKKLKAVLDKAIQQDAAEMQGIAWVLLGLLYDKAPGWPISIGDDKKAEQAYRKGLSINSTNIDANFFYGDFLRRKHRDQEARKHLLLAVNAKMQIGREIAHQGRLQDAKRTLVKLERSVIVKHGNSD